MPSRVLMPRTNRFFLPLLNAALMLPMPAAAFYTPLSDQAVREAYFLGQRGGESLASLLNSYTKFLRTPATGAHGPHVFSISFLTPFALIARYSSLQSDHSVQQAEKDHHPDEETVSIEINIHPTKYDWPTGPSSRGVRSGGPLDYYPSSYGFWKSFKYRVFDGKKEMTTENVTVQPQYDCGDGGCGLTNLIVRIQFPAAAFTADSATIKVTPPEDETVSVDFDLSALR